MSKEISKWSDGFMFKAEESNAAEGPTAYLLGGPTDPLGQIAACAKMYKGEVVRNIEDVTDEERHAYLSEIQKTVLKMPLEAVSLHFMVEGVTRGITHQMVRQRTAAFAQESTRFAVKEDMKTATALPPHLADTLSLEDFARARREADKGLGIEWRGDWEGYLDEVQTSIFQVGGLQADRLRWDNAVDSMGEAYLALVNSGMPAEDARGLLPTNITTRLNYITNLRSWYDTMAVRVSDQAQFEWRAVAVAMAQAMRVYGATQYYAEWVTASEARRIASRGENMGFDNGGDYKRYNANGEPLQRIIRSSAWQYNALADALQPIEFKIGGPAFGANFDRPSRIGERVRAFHKKGVPSSQWTRGSEEFQIPAIQPEEWLSDPKAARLKADEEFDIYGNRAPLGKGEHWSPEFNGNISINNDTFKE